MIYPIQNLNFSIKNCTYSSLANSKTPIIPTKTELKLFSIQSQILLIVYSTIFSQG